MEEFIQKTNGKESMIRTHRHAKKGRALGLGVMGWHTFLQKKDLPFNSIASTAWTHTVFSQIKLKAEVKKIYSFKPILSEKLYKRFIF